MKRRAAVHAAHRQELHFRPLPIERNEGFVPIYLRFHARRIRLWHEDLQPALAMQAPPIGDVLPHRAFGNRMLRVFLGESHVNAMRRMPLLARGLLIGFQNFINETLDRCQLWRGADRYFAFRRDRVGHRLAHHPTMDAEFARHPGNGALTKLILTSNLFK